MEGDSKQSLFLENEEATVSLGVAIGSVIMDDVRKTGVIIHLIGDLGAGKTTFCRGILKAFGHHGAVKSPTYTLVEPYDFDECHVRHFDLYRLGDPEELEYMGIRDYFGVGNLCLIEWPNRGEGVLPEADLIATVTVKVPGRQVELCAKTGIGQSILNKFETVSY
ncbi:MAG: tRNA (adenosine(37)-N6)-threonylcarbamoyltransferase complex ATPase subunit type 1 TsaE [Cellvibrionaceae bacterium]